MNIVHFYPQGALQTEQEVLNVSGNILYSVYGLGKSSYVQAHYVPRQTVVHVRSNGHSRYVLRDPKNEISEYLFMHDRNIGAHYNSHYLFLNPEDAGTYLAYARKHTQSWSGSYV